MHVGTTRLPGARWVWKNWAPQRVKFFIWLVLKHRRRRWHGLEVHDTCRLCYQKFLIGTLVSTASPCYLLSSDLKFLNFFGLHESMQLEMTQTGEKRGKTSIGWISKTTKAIVELNSSSHQTPRTGGTESWHPSPANPSPSASATPNAAKLEEKKSNDSDRRRSHPILPIICRSITNGTKCSQVRKKRGARTATWGAHILLSCRSITNGTNRPKCSQVRREKGGKNSDLGLSHCVLKSWGSKHLKEDDNMDSFNNMDSPSPVSVSSYGLRFQSQRKTGALPPQSQITWQKAVEGAHLLILPSRTGTVHDRLRSAGESMKGTQKCLQR